MTSMRLLQALLFALLIAFGAPHADAAVYITELMAVNDTTLADEDGDFSDWVELFNDGPGAVDLANWYLTDNAGDLMKWQFPTTSLGVGQYIVVFASGKNRAVAGLELHTSYKLGGGGEYLALVQSDGSTVEHEYTPEYPAQLADISYGLASDLTTERCFHDPTPGVVNDETQGCGDIDPLVFSPPHGFYYTSQGVVLSTTTPGAQIYYTLDGSEPTDTTGTLYVGSIPITTTTYIRARAYEASLTPSAVVTHTYIFPDDVVLQDNDPGFPDTWQGDYEMDPIVVTDPRYAPTISADLLSLPTISLVTDIDHLFGAVNGIYSHPDKKGIAWERPASIEIITADGSEDVQANCGIRIQGDLSRTQNRKKSLRLAFKSIYGPDRFDYAFFEDNPVDSYNKIRLRAGNQDCLCSGSDSTTYIRDQFVRDSQLRMSGDASRGRFMHLYLNGQYWGVYNAVEKPDESYWADHFGGDEADWDVMKHAVETVAGNDDAWFAAHAVAEAGVQSPAGYAALKSYVDVANLADYMIVNQYVGTSDWDGNNWYAGRERTPGGLWRFVSWDAEISMKSITSNKISINNNKKPSALYSAARDNEEFRVLFGDRVHEHFFNDGTLTPTRAKQRYLDRILEIDRAVVPESARWGDINHSTPQTRDDDWLVNVEWARLVFFTQRPEKLIAQYRKAGLYPDADAPTFAQHGGSIASGFGLAMSAPAGTIYYTIDGSDPRSEGGAVAPAATSYVAPVSLLSNTTVSARANVGGAWSALVHADFIVDVPLRITELMYHPADPPAGPYADEDFEFVEITNLGTAAIDLAGMALSDGVVFTFPSYSLGAGNRALVVRNQAAFESRYGVAHPVVGVYLGSLNNGGENLRLDDVGGDAIQEFVYDDAWYRTTDGDGYSLSIRDASVDLADWNSKDAWIASTFIDGSPDAVDGPHCGDGVDNDGDGNIDLGDSGCGSSGDLSERPECDDGIDNDLDGTTDLSDPGCAATSDASETDPPATSFICYKGKTNRDGAPFVQTDATVDDAIEGSLDFTLRKQRSVCLASTLDAAAPVDTDTHVISYDIRATTSVSHVEQEDLYARSLGPVVLDTSKPDRLLVPAAVDETTPVTPPLAASHNVDHYKCYRAGIAKASPKYFPRSLQLSGSNTFDGVPYDFRKPRRLCYPADVNGQGIEDPTLLMLCYQAKLAKKQPKHLKRIGVYTADEFGVVQFDTQKVDEICVPARL